MGYSRTVAPFGRAFICIGCLAAVPATGWSNPADGATTMRKITVEAADEQSYAAGEVSVGKTGQTLREIPQSMSILTRQRLDDQNFVTLPEAMKYATGVTVFRFDGNGNFNSFNARGYAADSFLLDGLNVRTDSNMVDLDLAIFERIEVLRGPAGLFQGSGEPGITINLVRKRAAAETQVKTLLGAGSWNNYRGEFDLTGALTDSGRVRGRLVSAYEDRDSHLDGVTSEKRLAYGTLEFDVTDSSTLSVGGTYQDVEAVIDQGLPAFADGRLVDVARSKAIIADWNLQDMKTAEGFVELDQHFDSGAQLKIAARRHEREMYYLSGRANGLVGNDGTMRVQYVDNFTDQTDTTADIFFSMPFELGGKSHSWLLGADYRKGDNFNTHSDGAPTLSNIYTFDRHIPRPPLVEALAQRTRSSVEQYGIYGKLSLRPIERLNVLLGARVSWWESVDRSALTGAINTEGEEDGEITPNVGVVYDLNDNLSLYASYSDIFKPQTQRTFAGEQLEPRTGTQYETGVKGEFLDGQLNAHVAVFRLTDENRALADPDNPGFFLPIGKVRSQGGETEVSGNLSASWSLGAGYAYNSTKYLKAAVTQQGTTFATFTPKHSFNVWTHYVFREGPLAGFEVGGGARAVSEFYQAAGNVRFVGDSYTVVSSQIGYTFAGRHKLALNIDNLLDEKYYEKVSGASRQNYYGAPLSVMLTMRSSF